MKRLQERRFTTEQDMTYTSDVRRLDDIGGLWLSEDACYLETIGLRSERTNAAQGDMISLVMIVRRMGILVTGCG